MEDELFLAVIFAVGGLLLLGFGVSKLKTWWNLINGRGVSIAEAEHANPPIRVEGEIEPLDDGDVLQSPLFGEECVLYEYRVQRRRSGDSTGSNWILEKSGRDSIPFLVRDNTGAAIVDPEEATWSISPETKRGHELSSEDTFDPAADLMIDFSMSSRRKLSEERLSTGDEVMIYGDPVSEGSRETLRIQNSSKVPEFFVSDEDISVTGRRLLFIGGGFILISVIILSLSIHLLLTV